MRQIYKDTFNQIPINEEAKNKILTLLVDKKSMKNKIRHKAGTLRPIILLLVLIIVSIPTITAIAAGKIDVFKVFGGLFGEKSELLQGNSSLPDVKVITDTFENIDIEITGIAGDKNVIYIVMELTKMDGSSFKKGQLKFGTTSIALMKAKEMLNREYLTDGAVIEKDNNIILNMYVDDQLRTLPDENPKDNKVTLAYIAELNTEMYGETYFIPGETYFLQFKTLYGSDFSLGTWEAEIVADYKETDCIALEVGKEAKYPEWGSENYENMKGGVFIESLTLTPVALRYHLKLEEEAILKNNSNRNNVWCCIYLEMKDGETIGATTFDEYMDSVERGAKGMQSGINGDCYWILDEPIALDNVKAIHFGDLTVDINP